MKIFKSVLFILLVILAQAIVGFLEYRYLSLTLGFFALILIVFVQGLQMILEYHLFSPRFNAIIKILFGFVVIAIMGMNINYLYLSREKFDVQDMENEIKQTINEKYQEDLARYNAELEQYNAEFEAYKENIKMKKDAIGLKYESEMKQYNSLLKEYKDQKAFYEEQINNLNSRASKIQRDLNRWGVTKSEKENMQKELDYIKNEKPKLMKAYNELTAPTPPDRETLTIESFEKEKPIMPKKEDIKIEKDRRLEILYWLIAAILEFGSLALLILLNQTINDKKKPKENNTHHTYTSNKSEKKNKHYKNKKAKVSIENNISMVDDDDNSIEEDEEVLTKSKSKTQTNRQNNETTAIAEREYTMEDIRFIIEKYNTPKQRKTFTNNNNQKTNNKKQKKIVEKEYVPNPNDSRYINNDNQKDKELTSEKKNNEEKTIKKKVSSQQEKEDNTTNKEEVQPDKKNMITNTLNQLIELDENSGDNENDRESDNINDSKIIYVYREDEKRARIKEAIEELRNMTMFQRKVFVEKLNKELVKPVSFKTLGVWASRDYIPTKKVDAVIKALGLDEEDSNIQNIH